MAVLLTGGAVASLLVAGVLPAGASHQFNDVPDTHPFHDDIAWLTDLEITQGFPDGGYHPGAPVTRQAMAAFLHRLWLALGPKVDHAGDTRDDDPGDGTCADLDGDCTLRAAVDEVNAGEIAPRIWVRPGVEPVLARAGDGEDANDTGDLDVSSSLLLVGHGTTIDGSGLDRVLDHHAGDLAVLDATVTGGSADVGGGIRSVGSDGLDALQGADALILTGATVTGNEVTHEGGGIAVDNGSLELTDSIVTDIVATRVVPPTSPDERYQDTGDGGGVFLEGTDAAIADSIVSSNEAGRRGGGVWFLDGSLEIHESAIGGNVAEGRGLAGCLPEFGCATDAKLGEGCGLWLTEAEARITDTALGENLAGHGGAIRTEGGSLVFTEGSLHLNVAGGANFEHGFAFAPHRPNGLGGAILSIDNATTIEGALIQDDHALRAGGGIHNQSGDLVVVSSRLYRNVTDGEQLLDSGDGFCYELWEHRGEGGGLSNEGSAQIHDSTIDDNAATWHGGGIHNEGSLTLDRSSVTGNSVAGEREEDDCEDPIVTPVGSGGGSPTTRVTSAS